MSGNRSIELFPIGLAALVAFCLASGADAGSLVFQKNGYVDVGDVFNVPQGTIEFWFKPKTVENNEWVLSKAKDKNNSMVLGFGPEIFMFAVKRAGQLRYAFIDKFTIAPGRWHHVAVTFRKDQVGFFVDGLERECKVSDPGGNYGLDHLTGGRFAIGKGIEEEFYNGLLGEVRLSDILRYTGDFTPPSKPLEPDDHTAALWRFEGKGKELLDSSGNNHHGTIVGAVARSNEQPSRPKEPATPAPGPAAQPAPLVTEQAAKTPPTAVIPTAAGTTRATIRADGTLLVNDRPVFPVAMRTEQLDSLKPIAEAGFNMVLGSGEWGPKHYAEAQRNNLLVLGGHYVWATFATFRGKGAIDLRPSEEAGLQNVLRSAHDQSGRLPLETLAAFDRLPGVIGWDTNEEPEGRLVESLEYAYEIFKSHSPSHIVATLSCDPSWFHLWRNTCDVLIVDNYPFRGRARNKRSLLETYEWLRHAVEVMGVGKSVWLMPQLIPPSEWSRNPADEISLRDMRLQNYIGLIAGAKGIIMYHWAALGVSYGRAGRQQVSDEVFQRRWNTVKAMVKELNALAPILCDARPTAELQIFWLSPGAQGPGPQMTRELDYYGRKYLLVANLLDVPIEGKVYGINRGNRRAYRASVFLGEGDLSVSGVARNIDYDEPGGIVIKVGPRGAGVFLLERRPVLPVQKKE